MIKDIKEYFESLKGAFENVIATDSDGKVYQLAEAVDMSVRLIIAQAASGRKLIFIGNGASAAISSHMAVDFWKNAGIRSLSFNDSSLLTCISNDYGYRHVFERPIEMFADNDDILVAISSSGKSENIIRGVQMAIQKGCHIVTLSGFGKDNPLRLLGGLNFYVPSFLYSHVEVMHHSICHCMLNSAAYKRGRSGITAEKMYE